MTNTANKGAGAAAVNEKQSGVGTTEMAQLTGQVRRVADALELIASLLDGCISQDTLQVHAMCWKGEV
jgi:hypothetical protein